ncbi:MAG: sigma factor-like helix-turn-helix DNA-binding protein [bacterium]|nr:sigma factor-like helix-turn-helix DNA-binding protein [bacterium]
MATDYSKLTLSLLSELDPRTREILISRFGLEKKEPLTLEAIGKKFDITRERVRQIVEEGIKEAQKELVKDKKSSFLSQIFAQAGKILKRSGDVKREDMLIEELLGKGTPHANHVVFLLSVAPKFTRLRENDLHYTFWASDPDVASQVPSLLKDLLSHFQKSEQAHSADELHKSYDKGIEVSHLEIAKEIEQGFDSKWGLTEWPTIKPRGVRDKAYLLLKREGKPMHFTDVTHLIDEFYGEQRKALVQTVHNELIKDPRFILVGRGTYGLGEWGLNAGTVKDVISKILQEYRKPMAKEILIQKTLAQRQVKPSTIALNLQDRTYFVRDEQGRYQLR